LIIAGISRTFTKAETFYSTVKEEELALLYTLQAMDFFLRFVDEVAILMDAKDIFFLRLCKDFRGTTQFLTGFF
jgi:hypothetical protein